jgi:hypothetical protein
MATASSFVPVDQVIATAMSISEGADTIDRAFMKDWVYLGLQEIGPNVAWYGEAVLYPTDYTFQKPANMHSAIDITLYDSAGKELRYTFRGKGHRGHQSDNILINDGTYAPGLGAPIDLSEDAYYYHIGTSDAASIVSHAFLKYWKFPVDEHGDLMVPEQDVLPLAKFVKYMLYFRKDDKQGIRLTHPIWTAARNEARAAHKIPDGIMGTEIARTFQSLIQKQRFKQF